MDFLQLKLFISLSRTLNFTRTANEFFMSQPTVSNQIRALENELGVELLRRSSHHVELTAAGTEYIRYAAQILETQSAAEIRLRNLAADRPGFVRVAMLSSSAPFFTKVLTAFSKSWPQVQVDVTMMEGGEMLKALRGTDYDIYFANEPMMPPKNDRLCHALTGVSQLHLFVNTADAPSIDLSDWQTVGAHPFVSIPASDFTLSAQIERVCEARGIKPNIINYYNRADMLLLSVASGTGVAILPREVAAARCPEGVTALAIEGEDAAVRAVIAWKADSANPDADRFRDIALQLAGT